MKLRAAWTVSPRAILVIGWFVAIFYAYPGYMNNEAVDQLIDSRYGSFSDWHSPMLTLVWRLVGIVVSGPPGMLVLQVTALLLGAYHLFRRTMSDRAAAIAASALLVFPPVLATTGLICEESQLVAFLLLGILGLASPRRALKLGGLVALLVASAMRPGAALLVLPVIALGFVWRDDHRGALRYAVAFVTWALIAACAAGLNALLVDKVTRRVEVSLAERDIAGTIAKAGPIDDAALRDELAGLTLRGDSDLQRRIRECYGRGLSIMTGEHRVFEAPTSDDGKQRLEDIRVSLALAYPGGYARHRGRIAIRVLGVSRNKDWKPVVTSFVGHPDHRMAIHHSARHAAPQRLLVRIVQWFSEGPLFRPYVYVAIALILLPLAIRRRHRDAVMLLAAGVAYELALVVVTEAPELRLSHPMIVTTLLAVVLMVARHARPHASR